MNLAPTQTPGGSAEEVGKQAIGIAVRGPTKARPKTQLSVLGGISNRGGHGGP